MRKIIAALLMGTISFAANAQVTAEQVNAYQSLCEPVSRAVGNSYAECMAEMIQLHSSVPRVTSSHTESGLAGLAKRLESNPQWQESLCMMMRPDACEHEQKMRLLRAQENAVRAGVPGALEDSHRTQMLMEQEKQTRELEEIREELRRLRAR